MRKILRMFLVVLMASFGFSAYAQTDELTWDKLLESGKQSNYQEFSGKTITSSAVYAGQASSGGDNYIQLRTTNSNSGIVTTVSGGKLKSITIDFNAKTTDRSVDIYGDNTAYTSATELYNSPKGTKLGSISAAEESKTLTVTGDYTFVGLRSNNGAIYIDKITIVWEGGGSTVTVPTPSISGTTPFTENTEVKISGTPEGGKTYYTTDGSDPTSSSTLYSDPFTLTETTTVKAISYDKDNNASSVATKIFEKETIEKAANIAELLAFEKGKKVTVTLNNAIVLYKGTNDIIIKDATGGTDFYQTGLELTKGQVLNGTITVLRDDYNGFKEAKKTDGTNLDNVTVTEGTVTPTVSTVANVATSEDCADLYKLENVEVVANGSNWDIVDGETTLRLRDQFKLNYTATAGKFNIIGVIGNYNGTKQFWPTEAPEATQEITIGEASDISEFIGLENGKPYKLTLENAQVVYSWTSDSGNTQAFVRDDSGAICFYFTKPDESLAANFTTNKMLNGSIIMNHTLYNGLPEATVTSETNTEKLTFSDGSDAQPIKITAAEVSKNLNDLVLLENVTITENEGKYYVDDVQVYNGFHFDAFNDLSSFVGEGKTIKGIALVNNTTYRILPIEITSQGGGETPATTSSMIKFAEGDSAADGTVFTSGELKLTLFDKNDPAKMAVDGNDAYFGTAEDYQKFDHRLKTGGKSGSKSSLTLTIPTDGTLKVYVRSASSSATDRNLVISQNGTDLYDNIIKENEETDYAQVDMGGEKPTKVFPVVSVTVKAGEVTIGYPTGALNFYAFELVTGSTGIQNVIKPAIENVIRYNLAGQRVDENYKGVVIMNGKKYVVK